MTVQKTFSLLLSLLALPLCAEVPDWENETVFRINKEDARATLDIELARHPVDLRPSETIFVNLDYGQMGLGGTNSWGQLPLPNYRLPAKGSYRYGFHIGTTP